MKIIVAHNAYRIRGGEDQVFDDEVALLASRGHDVVPYLRHNDDFSGLETIRVAAGTVWNRSATRDIADVVRRERADIVHVHNWMPQLSPAFFRAARGAGAAVVHTLHNYRFTCASGVLYRDGAVCEECVGRRVGLPAIRYGCYRDSRAATVPVVAAVAAHRSIGTFADSVDAYIVLSEFARATMIRAGLPAGRLHRKPNFVGVDPGERRGRGGYIAYVGRLDESKGIATLLAAWEASSGLPTLTIAGAGPLDEAVAAAATAPNIEFLGRIDSERVSDVMGDAVATILPTTNYEGFPKTVVESFAVGTPVIASDLGSLTELIDAGRTGILVPPGDPTALAHTVADTAGAFAGMRPAARAVYEDRYTSDHNYARLIEIYDSAIRSRHGG